MLHIGEKKVMKEKVKGIGAWFCSENQQLKYYTSNSPHQPFPLTQGPYINYVSMAEGGRGQQNAHVSIREEYLKAHGCSREGGGVKNGRNCAHVINVTHAGGRGSIPATSSVIMSYFVIFCFKMLDFYFRFLSRYKDFDPSTTYSYDPRT